MARVLRSGNLRQGSVTAEFEAAFAEREGCRHAIAVSSGTAALHLAYLALFSAGDEVIVPSFTFVATGSMLVAIGAVPVFADVDARTFTIDVDDVESKITERTRGVVGVHLFGNVCDVDGLRRLADDRGLTLVWDAAQALGSEYCEREVGQFPTAVCYSFYPTKNITTGEGGMIATDDDDLAATLRLARSQGASGKYMHTQIGFNYRMTDFQSALGLQQLARLDEYIETRRAHAAFLTESLGGVDGITVPLVPDYATHTFNQYCLLIDGAGFTRDDLAQALEDACIETAVHYPRGLHHQPVLASDGHHDVTEWLCHCILALPVHPKLSPSDLDRTATAVRTAATGLNASTA